MDRVVVERVVVVHAVVPAVSLSTASSETQTISSGVQSAIVEVHINELG